MEIRARGIHLTIAGYEVVMDGADMRAVMLTLGAGEHVPWHYHSETIDHFFCLEGPMVVETRAPRATHELAAGENCAVAPKTAHFVHGKNDGPCRFLLLQGIGAYDNVAVHS